MFEMALGFVTWLTNVPIPGMFFHNIENKDLHRPQSGRPFPKLMKKETAK